MFVYDDVVMATQLEGIDAEKLLQYRATFICQYGLCCCIVWFLFRFYWFVKIWATCENFLGKWFTAPPGKKLPVRLCLNGANEDTIDTSTNVTFKERCTGKPEVKGFNSEAVWSLFQTC